MHRSISRGRLAAVAAAAMLTLAAGCGDGDDKDQAAAGGNSASQTDSTTSAGDSSAGSNAAKNGGKADPKAAVNATLEGIQADYDAGRGASYCDRLTAAGIRQVERFGKTFGHGTQCAQIIAKLSKATREAGVKQKPSKLIAVKVKGDRAVATIRNGKRPPEPMIFVRDQGDWKIPDPGFKTQIGGSKKLEQDPAARAVQLEQFQKAFEQRNNQN